MEQENRSSVLRTADYIVIGIVMMISAGIGVYFRFTGGRQKTAEEYFVANRSMSVVPLGIALMVSFVSAITILGISAEIYAYGAQYSVIYFSKILATLAVAYFYLPVFFELNTVSVYEYLERRFGLAARLATSMANFMQLMLYTGIVLYAPSLAIEATTGLSSKTSIAMLAVICIFYSTIGGIKAVLATDIFQGFLMFGSLICIVAIASPEIEGGISAVWEIARQGHHADLLNFQLDPTVRHTWWGLIAGGFCLFCSLYGVNQVEVQRLLTVNSLRSARLALFVNLILLMCFGFFTVFCGLVLYAVYKDCDPVASGQISSHDRIMPYFAANKMSAYPGLTGLFVAGIFSAGLSTISAMLNSLAAVFLEDYLKRIYSKLGLSLPDKKMALFGKIIVVTNGLLSIGVAMLAGSFGSLVQFTISVMGCICGPVLGIFTLGMFFEAANEKGAIVGLVTALITCFWTSFGRPNVKAPMLPVRTDGCNFTITKAVFDNVTMSTAKPHTSQFILYRISYIWFGPMGLTITLLVGYCASLIFRKLELTSSIEPDPSLFTPLVARRIRKRRSDAVKTTSSQVFALEEPATVPKNGKSKRDTKP